MNKGTIIVGKNAIRDVFLAEKQLDQMVGLMHRPAPLPYMAFIYAKPDVARFWMKNTRQDLAIIYALGGKIMQIHRGEAFSTKLIGSEDILSDIVLEMPWETFERSQISIGDDIRLIQERQ